MKKFFPVVLILLLVIVLVPIESFAAYVWTDRSNAGSRNWSSVVFSADGTKMAAVVYGGDIYTSSNAGTSWIDRSSAGSRNWYDIAMSADGMTMIAAAYNGDIYTSINGGSTWTDQTTLGVKNWKNVSISSNGMKMVAAAYGNNIYVSLDSGSTWGAPTAGSAAWNGVAMSDDGSKIVAVIYMGDIYTSIDSGASWADQTISGNWQSVSSSSDGMKLIAAAFNGDIFTSTDGGNNWTDQVAAGSRAWKGVTISADGTKMAAVDYTAGNIYVSTDSGTTWTNQGTNAGSRNWQSVSMSSDGLKIAAAVYGGDIYTTDSLAVPVVVAGPTSSITTSSTTLGGNISNIGGENNTARGVNYGLTSSYGSTVSESGSYSTGAFTLNVTGLTCASTYHYQIFSTNSVGTGTSTDSTFDTLSCPRSGGGGHPPFVSSGGGGGTPVVLDTVIPAVVPVVVNPENKITDNNVVSYSSSKKLLKHLNKGMKDEDTKILQAFLIDQDVGTCVKSLYISSYFGPRTKSALAQWQKANGLDSDGVLGPQTRTMINGLLK